jgi:2-methylcitrate dehydratase PrpD
VDDGYRAGSVHPGAVVVPAVLSAGHERGTDGKTALTAIAVGYEVAARIAEGVIRATAKVKVTVDPECDGAYPRLRAARTRVVIADGRSFERKVDEPLGSPANPISDDALSAKFRGLALPVLGEVCTCAVEDLIWKLDDLGSIAELNEAMAG